MSSILQNNIHVSKYWHIAMQGHFELEANNILIGTPKNIDCG